MILSDKLNAKPTPTMYKRLPSIIIIIMPWGNVPKNDRESHEHPLSVCLKKF